MSINGNVINTVAINADTITIGETVIAFERPARSIDIQCYSNSASIVFERPRRSIDIYTGGVLEIERPSRSIGIVANFTGATVIEFARPSRTIDIEANLGSVATVVFERPYRSIDILTGGVLAFARPSRIIEINAQVYGGTTIAFARPYRSIDITAVLGGRADIVIERPGREFLFGSLEFARPSRTIEIVCYDEAANLIAYVMNISNTETTIYTNYAFKFIQRIGHNYYGFTGTKLYQLTGTDDNGTAISAEFTTAETDMETSYMKRVPYVYSDSENQVSITPYADGTSTGTFDSNLTGRRTHLSRGPKGRFWKFKVSNKAGNSLQVGSFEALPEVLSRKI